MPSAVHCVTGSDNWPPDSRHPGHLQGTLMGILLGTEGREADGAERVNVD